MTDPHDKNNPSPVSPANKLISGRPVVISITSILSQLFQNLLGLYLVMLLVNQFEPIFFPGTLNSLLVIVVVLGVVTIIFSWDEAAVRAAGLARLDYILVFGLSGAGFILLEIKMQQLGWLAGLINMILGAGLLIIIFDKDDEAADKNDGPVLKVNRKASGITAGLLLVLAGLLWVWLGTAAVSIVLGGVYTLFLSGFSGSYLFFDDGEIDLLERIALSVALSISILPLLVFYFNLAGVTVNIINISIINFIICAAGFVGYRKKQSLKKFLDNVNQKLPPH